MNYCTKCGSIYSQPGTCNCFATGTRVVPPLTPTYPQPWIPWTPAPQWPYGTTITYTVGEVTTDNAIRINAEALAKTPVVVPFGRPS